MNKLKLSLLAAVTGLLSIAATGAQAQIRITEVAPWASGNAPAYGADWFELTNIGSTAVNISGWKMDDSSASFATTVSLTGITSIAAGESVIFLETSSATTIANFKSAWFGSNVPASLQVGSYNGTGAGVGLSTSGDGVNIFNASGVLQASVSFGVSDGTSPYQTFDNKAGLNNATISQLSVVGNNGAFLTSAGVEVGSPGAVPEPENAALALAALAVIGLVARKRQA